MERLLEKEEEENEKISKKAEERWRFPRQKSFSGSFSKGTRKNNKKQASELTSQSSSTEMGSGMETVQINKWWIIGIPLENSKSGFAMCREGITVRKEELQEEKRTEDNSESASENGRRSDLSKGFYSVQLRLVKKIEDLLVKRQINRDLCSEIQEAFCDYSGMLQTYSLLLKRKNT